jgi:lysophospholipase L1-like esterase
MDSRHPMAFNCCGMKEIGMKRIHIGLVALALGTALLLLAPAIPRAVAETSSTRPVKVQQHPFENEIKAYEAADAQNPPPEGAIEFTGASGIRMWKTLQADFPDHKVFNRGFGGSQMSDSVYYADRIDIPYKPKLIVIQAGGNDINAGKSPEQVLADFKAFVEKIHAALPETRIAFLSLNPSPSRWAQRAKQQKVNELVKDYIATDKKLDYIDFWAAMLGPDGLPREDLFIKDRLHNNAAGYKIRADIVRPHLSEVPAQ